MPGLSRAGLRFHWVFLVDRVASTAAVRCVHIGYVGKTFFRSSRPSTVPKWTVIVSDRVRFAAVPLCPLGKFFLQRDAMLARYMLSSSVRHKPVVYRNDWTTRTAWFGHGGFFHLAYSVLYGNSGSS